MLVRHSLLKITEKGREFALLNCEKRDIDGVAELVRDMRIPAIVKRQENADNLQTGYIEIGFSSFIYENYETGGRVRLRAATKAPVDSILEVVTPFDAFSLAKMCDSFPFLRELEEIESAAGRAGLAVGLFGSSALQAVTGYPYVNESSDIDVIVKPYRLRGECDLKLFASLLDSSTPLKNVKIDIELDISDGFAVKLRELLSSQRTVLAKGINDAKILDRQSVLESISGI